MEYKIINDDCLKALETLGGGSVDAIITDPPYELGFMGNKWDSTCISFQKETWEKCLRVLKPGGYLLAFGGSRTFHRMACAIEDAGFEIRDTIMWLYGSGFPKSMNIGLAIDKKNGVESKVIGERKQSGAKFKLTQELIDNGGFNDPNRNTFEIKEATNEWRGWGTALKPSYEPIIVARKPLDGTCVDNVLKYGTGGINIDECRIEFSENEPDGRVGKKDIQKGASKNPFASGISDYDNTTYKSNGRFPSNIILTYDDNNFEEVCSTMGDKGSACRYFYCAKCSKRDREEGLENFGLVGGGTYKFRTDGSLDGKIPSRKNTHPTVKPTNLMAYLIRLVAPKNATILDPFMGSGSTGKAVAYENKDRNTNYKFIGIEQDSYYCKIAKARIDFVEESE